LKFAGGSGGNDTIDIDEFLKQAAEYETTGGAWDAALKVLNTAFRDHPFATVRAAELQRWMTSGAYDRILAGEYMRRGDPARPLGDDVADAAGYYGEQVRTAMSGVGEAVDRARRAFEDAFRGAAGPR
jgi:hypothetical protein